MTDRLANKFGEVVAFVFNTIADDGKNLQRNLLQIGNAIACFLVELHPSTFARIIFYQLLFVSIDKFGRF